jgi:hypothetical protein
LPFLLRLLRYILVSFAVLAACRQGTAPAAQAQAVGWTLNIPGERLREGRLLTDPPGLEERLLSALANASFASARSCAQNLPASAANANVTFAVEVSGRVRDAAVATGGDLLSACIARQLGSKTLAGVKLTTKTGAKLQLVFAAATVDGGAIGKP